MSGSLSILDGFRFDFQLWSNNRIEKVLQGEDENLNFKEFCKRFANLAEFDLQLNFPKKIMLEEQTKKF